MDVVALDTAKLTALMVAGAAFALAGLWLMFKPQPAGEAAKIELFGLKFQASSAGLVVFLIGAVFLAMPIVVPEKPSDRAPEPPAGSPGEGAPAPELPLPRRAGAEEIEGNDVISESNALALGQTVSGKLPPGDFDWFVVGVEAGRGDQIRITFRNVGNERCPSYNLLDASENLVDHQQVCSFQVSSSREHFIDSDRYYIRVDASGSRTQYELAVEQR